MIEQEMLQLLPTLAKAESYREAGRYVQLSNTLPLATGHHHSNGLRGNLGAILYRSPAGFTLGRGWIAPSKKIRKSVRKAAFQVKDTLLHYCGNHTIASCSCESDYRSLPAPLTAPDPRHANDSEHVLLNTLHFHLTQLKLKHGTVQLLTERIPCQSCTDVIMQFARAYPSISVAVAYLFDYVNDEISRSHVDFFRQWNARKAADISLFKLEAIGDGWKLIALTETTPLLECGPTYFAPGARRFGLVNGEPGAVTWREEDSHQLRDVLRILPSQ